MEKKKILNVMLCVLAVLVGLYAVLAAGNNARERRKAEENRPVVLFRTEEPISELCVSYGGETADLILSDGRWVLRCDAEFPVDQTFPGAMAIKLQTLTAKRMVSDNAEDLTAYGLEPGYCTLRIALSDGNGKTFRFGNYYPTGGCYYVLDADTGSVYLVDDGVCEVFFYGLYEMLEPETMEGFDPSEVTGFTLQEGDACRRILFLENGSDTVYTDAYHWFLQEEDGTLQPLNSSITESLLRRIAGFSYEGSDEFGTEESILRRRALEAPEDKITVTLRSGEQREILFGARDEARGIRFAVFTDARTVGYVSEITAENLLCPDIENYYLASDVCRIPLEEILSMEITADGTVWTAERGLTDGKASYSVNGTSVDGEAFESFYAGLAALESEAVVSDGAEADAPAVYSVDFVRNTDRFRNMTLEFAEYNANFYLVRFNEQARLVVSRRAVDAWMNSFRSLTPE